MMPHLFPMTEEHREIQAALLTAIPAGPKTSS